jgi:hypothetical protein
MRINHHPDSPSRKTADFPQISRLSLRNTQTFEILSKIQEETADSFPEIRFIASQASL